ncbi:hypothetical protein E0H80_09560 [Acinetobacter sp. ANC 4779]|uniref:hypothetical protein n=1 Tax=Acinetobacter sp. ANC 4779 TaxID=2529848 RepID=UPI0010F30573|nr:hypothetical protein [Acinetobacter sp. ANC 4779]TCB50071.1 hypothetical protein E0H80_09560 [Acinetobacter sp. ANC 4779]
MMYKKRILFSVVCTTLFSGCGENFSVGATKGGSGTGKPNEHDINIVIEKVPLHQDYTIWLSKPKIDYCQGIKRTLQFLNPLSLETVENDQLLEVSPTDEIESQVILQLRWENQSDYPKTVFQPSCDDVIELAELGEELPIKNMSCDVEKITVLEKNDIYISDYVYKFTKTSNGMLKHSKYTQFLPLQGSGLDCGKLQINYEIKNK